MTEQQRLNDEERAVFRAQVEDSTGNILRFERELREIQAKLKAEYIRRDTFAAKLGNSPGDDLPASRPSISGGLSENIRAVLRDSVRPIRPSAVVEELKRRQFPYTATTPMITRVGNEIRRMTRAGMLIRRGHKYELAQPKTNGGLKEAGVSAAS